MATIVINRFSGVVKAVSERLINSNFATEAVNCDLSDYSLKPIRGLGASVKSLSHTPATIYRYTPTHWFSFTGDVDVARAPTAYDNTDRVVYTGVNYPRQTRNDIALGTGVLPRASYRLGVPAPSSPPSLSVLGTADPDQQGLESDIFYVFCYVTAWGEEGPPSFPAGPVTVTDGQSVRLSMPAPPSGAYNFGSGAKKRIYRSNSGSSSTAFQYLGEVSIGTTLFTDSSPAAALGEVIPSITWDAPPDENTSRYPSGQMLGVRSLPSGSLVGFSGNTLVYSEPYLPHAWGNIYPLPNKIVAIETTSSGVLVTTTDKPVIAMGIDPRSVAIQELDVRQACVSKRSMVDMGEYALYASPDGLVALSNGSAEVVTGSILTRSQWQELNPSSIIAFMHNGSYIAKFTRTNGSVGAFSFTPGNEQEGLSFIEGINFNAGHYSPSDDILYMAVGNSIRPWGEGSPMSYRWTSKLFQLNEPTSFSCLQIHADSYPCTIRLYLDGVRYDYTVQSEVPTRIAPIRAHHWQFTLTGTNRIHSVALSTSMTEIASV